MSTKHFAGGLAVGASLVGIGAFIALGAGVSIPPSEFPYCYQFDPKPGISTFVLASVVAIRGGDRDHGYIIGWSKSPDQFMPTWPEYSDQWKRCER